MDTKEDLGNIYKPSDDVVARDIQGELIIVPKENIKPINASGTDMMKFIISGGVTHI